MWAALPGADDTPGPGPVSWRLAGKGRWADATSVNVTYRLCGAVSGREGSGPCVSHLISSYQGETSDLLTLSPPSPRTLQGWSPARQAQSTPLSLGLACPPGGAEIENLID